MHFICLAKKQYYPKALIIQSEQFIQFLYTNNLKSAYDLTTKKKEYYDISNPFLFKKAVERQAKSFLKANIIEVQYRTSFPSQTYGNRLRRWFAGREINTKQKSVNFFIYINDKKDINSVVPFEVRWKLQPDQNWKILFFQSHAI